MEFNNNPAKFVIVEVKLGSKRVGASLMRSEDYIALRQQFALKLNNCFRQEKGDQPRWASLLPTAYKGWDRRKTVIKTVELPMSTQSSEQRWQEFETLACKAFGLIHRGYEEKILMGEDNGNERGHYIPDGTDSLGINYEIKSDSGRYRKGQVGKSKR